MLWTIEYGKGRVFVTALGHDVEQVQTAAFVTTLRTRRRVGRHREGDAADSGRDGRRAAVSRANGAAAADAWRTTCREGRVPERVSRQA